MADDLVDAENMVRDHKGIENDEVGRVAVRVLRSLRQLTIAVKDLRDRVAALESK